jgi:hypothetical protein
MAAATPRATTTDPDRIEIAGIVPRVLAAPLRATRTVLDGADGYLVELAGNSIWIDRKAADQFGRKLLFD